MSSAREQAKTAREELRRERDPASASLQNSPVLFGADDPLYTLWCAALDAVNSDDFRHADGSLDEDAYTRYQTGAIGRARVEAKRQTLNEAAEALLAEGAHDDLCSYGPPGTCDCSLGRHYRWLIARGQA